MDILKKTNKIRCRVNKYKLMQSFSGQMNKTIVCNLIVIMGLLFVPGDASVFATNVLCFASTFLTTIYVASTLICMWHHKKITDELNALTRIVLAEPELLMDKNYRKAMELWAEL